MEEVTALTLLEGKERVNRSTYEGIYQQQYQMGAGTLVKRQVPKIIRKVGYNKDKQPEEYYRYKCHIYFLVFSLCQVCKHESQSEFARIQ